jgi:hypothetical protein
MQGACFLEWIFALAHVVTTHCITTFHSAHAIAVPTVVGSSVSGHRCDATLHGSKQVLQFSLPTQLGFVRHEQLHLTHVTREWEDRLFQLTLVVHLQHYVKGC